MPPLCSKWRRQQLVSVQKIKTTWAPDNMQHGVHATDKSYTVKEHISTALNKTNTAWIDAPAELPPEALPNPLFGTLCALGNIATTKVYVMPAEWMNPQKLKHQRPCCELSDEFKWTYQHRCLLRQYELRWEYQQVHRQVLLGNHKMTAQSRHWHQKLNTSKQVPMISYWCIHYYQFGCWHCRVRYDTFGTR